jgi:hypothetical protein
MKDVYLLEFNSRFVPSTTCVVQCMNDGARLKIDLFLLVTKGVDDDLPSQRRSSARC